MDTFLAIASRREVRKYSDRPLPDDVVHRILDAGRLSGSSQNKQKWEFVIVRDHAALAEAVYAPENVQGAQLAVAIAGEAAPFDIGRAAQNMLLAAWNEGVGASPNGVKDPDRAAEVAGSGPVKMVLTFGYPERPRDPQARTAAEWSARANRKPFAEVVRET